VALYPEPVLDRAMKIKEVYPPRHLPMTRACAAQYTLADSLSGPQFGKA